MQGTDSIYIPACAKCDYSRSFCRPARSRRSRAYDRDAWHCSFTWSSGVTASQATRMSNLDHDMLSIFLVAFRMRRKLAQVSWNQHGPGTSRSACAALRTRIRPPMCVETLCTLSFCDIKQSRVISGCSGMPWVWSVPRYPLVLLPGPCGASGSADARDRVQIW